MSSFKKNKIGKYRIEKTIGRGASGIVFKAHDSLMGRDVAIKLLNSELDVLPDATSAVSRERFLCEAKAYGRLRHLHIVSCYSCEEIDDNLFLVMEYVEGLTLKEILDRRKFLPQNKAIELILQILDALSYAHQRGVVHRDIKPSNIMLDNEGNVKIADFGIARLDSTDLTRTGMVLGSPGYMSPEQFLGQKVDARTDVFSVAVIFYQLITRHLPFRGDDLGEVLHKVLYEQPAAPQELNLQCSALLSDVIMKGMNKKSEQRFASAADFSEAIINVVKSQSTSLSSSQDLTMLESQEVNVSMGQSGVQHWVLNKRSIGSIGFITAVASFFFLFYVSQQENSMPEPAIAEITRFDGIIGGDESTFIDATKQESLYSSVGSLIDSVSCMDSRFELHRSSIGYQVDLHGYYANSHDVDTVTTNIAKLPGVVAVNNQMNAGISPYCDFLSFADFATKRENIILKQDDVFSMEMMEGEHLMIGLNTLEEPLYYYIDYFLLDGSVVHLSPGSETLPNFYSSRQQVYIGAEESSSQWEVTAPFGLEMVSVLAMDKPLKSDRFSDSTSVYLAQLKEAITMSDAVLVSADYLYISTKRK